MSFKTIVHKPDGTIEIRYDIGALSNNTKKSEREEFLKILATLVNYNERLYSKKIRKNQPYPHPQNKNTNVFFSRNIIAAVLDGNKRTVVYLMFKVTDKDRRFRGEYGEMKETKVIDKKGKVSDGLYCLKVEKKGMKNPKDVVLFIDKICAEAGFNYKVNKSRKNYNFEVPVFVSHKAKSEINKDGTIKITGAHITSYQPMQLYKATLWQLLKSGKESITFPCLLYIILQMLKALKKMSKTGVVHGDINSGNVCISFSKRDKLNIHFIDFGLSPKKGSRTTGTYASPEYFCKPIKYTAHPKDDVFALGILILDFFCFWLGEATYKMFNSKYRKSYRKFIEKHSYAVKNSTFSQITSDSKLDLIKEEFFNPIIECVDICCIPHNEQRSSNIKLLNKLKTVLHAMINPIRKERIDASTAFRWLRNCMRELSLKEKSLKNDLSSIVAQINPNSLSKKYGALEQANWCFRKKQFSKAVAYAKRAFNSIPRDEIKLRIEVIELMANIYKSMHYISKDKKILDDYEKIIKQAENILSGCSMTNRAFDFFSAYVGIICKLKDGYDLAINHFDYSGRKK